MEYMNHQYPPNPYFSGMPIGDPSLAQPGAAGPMTGGMGQPGVAGSAFPGPTPSPWPPSPMMPGPTMQPQGISPGSASTHAAPEAGHDCGNAGAPGHPGAPSMYVHTGISPTAMPHDYMHTAYHVEPASSFPATGTPQTVIPAGSPWYSLNFRNDQFWKGVVLGTAVTLLVTNETVQKTLMKGTAKVLTLAQAGVEEIKEKFEDIQAELRQEKEKVKQEK